MNGNLTFLTREELLCDQGTTDWPLSMLVVKTQALETADYM